MIKEIDMDKPIIAIDLDETLIYNSCNDWQYGKDIIYTYDTWTLIENVDVSLKKLYDKYDFIIITSRCDDGGAKQIINIIEKKLEIKFLNIICTSGNDSKLKVAKKNNCKYLIDDLCTNLFDCEKYNIKGIYFTDCKCYDDNLIVKSNWLDITDYLLK